MSNRLAAEKSPYLRQHADNPVDWRPWGDAALAQAAAEQKPVFLSIGYSSCHWCHVMAHESFEDEAIAATLNRDFIPVKVDREERPDLDRIYMTFVQQTSGHGGWPLSVWLTPQGHPFYGGTYFPPEDRSGRPGFLTVLHAIARHWHEQRAKLESGAADVVAALRDYAGQGEAGDGDSGTLAEAAADAWERGFRHFRETFDSEWGGFGGAPKFPRASTVNFLFRVGAGAGAHAEPAVRMSAHTLQRMAEGGLHDHVGGGFHRYSVDERWHVPHFEKMLYDQAQIALNFLEAWQATGVGAFAWVARGIFDYVRRDLTGPRGGFYSAEDADSEVPGPAAAKAAVHGEGAFYTWSRAEVDAVLGTDADFFCSHFGVRPDGNVAADPQGEFRGRNVLMQQRALAATARDFGLDVTAATSRLADCLERLRAARGRRPRPSLDDKVIAAWNGLMISALARGHQALGDAASGNLAASGATPASSDCLKAATRAAEFLAAELFDATTGTLYRSWRDGRGDVPGFAEDYACLIQGLLDLYEAGFEIRWLQWAERLQQTMDDRFWDEARGGYLNSRADDPTVIVRLKEDYDGAEPAPSSVAALNLLRLDWMVGDASGPAAPADSSAAARGLSRREKAGKTLEALRPQWSRVPHALPQMLCALELVRAEPRTVVIAGDPGAADFRALTAVLAERIGPRRVLLCADGAGGQEWLGLRTPYLAGMKALGGRATAFVCENFACQAPVTDPDALRRVL